MSGCLKLNYKGRPTPPFPRFIISHQNDLENLRKLAATWTIILNTIVVDDFVGDLTTLPIREDSSNSKEDSSNSSTPGPGPGPESPDPDSESDNVIILPPGVSTLEFSFGSENGFKMSTETSANWVKALLKSSPYLTKLALLSHEPLWQISREEISKFKNLWQLWLANTLVSYSGTSQDLDSSDFSFLPENLVSFIYSAKRSKYGGTNNPLNPSTLPKSLEELRLNGFVEIQPHHPLPSSLRRLRIGGGGMPMGKSILFYFLTLVKFNKFFKL